MVPVHGHHVARLREVDHQLELLGVAVTRGVHGHVGGGDHVGAELVDAVDRLVHRALVARDGRGREDHGVAVVEVDVRMVAVRHPPQRRQRLPLRPRGDDHELVVREVLDLLRADQHSLGCRCVPASGRCSCSCASSGRSARRACPRRPPRRPPAGRGGCSRRSRSRRCGHGSGRRPPGGAGRRSTPTATSPGGRRWWSSPHRSSRPSRPSSARRETSAGTPSTGVWSNL